MIYVIIFFYLIIFIHTNFLPPVNFKAVLLHFAAMRSSANEPLPSRPKRKSRAEDDDSGPALITESEAMDGWLEDDMGQRPRTKRQRTEVDGFLYGNTVHGANKSRSSKLSLSQTKRSRNSTESGSSLPSQTREWNKEYEEKDSEKRDAGDETENSPTNSTVLSGMNEVDALFQTSDEEEAVFATPIPPPPSSINRPVKSKQLKLTDFTSSGANLEDSIQSLEISSTSPTATTTQSAAENNGGGDVAMTQAAPGVLRRVRVKIEEKTIMIPVTSTARYVQC